MARHPLSKQDSQMPQTLSERLRQPGLVVAPGVYDLVSAKLADQAGFDALYMSGFGVVA